MDKGYFSRCGLNFLSKEMEREFKEYQLAQRTMFIVKTYTVMTFITAGLLLAVLGFEYVFDIHLSTTRYLPIWLILLNPLLWSIYYVLLTKYPKRSTIWSSIFIPLCMYISMTEAVMITRPPEWFIYSQ